MHVWAPHCARSFSPDPGIAVHRLPGQFTVGTLGKVGRALRALPEPRRLLVQYVPQAFGWKGMNIPFARWLRKFRGFPLQILFHEVALSLEEQHRFKHRILAHATRYMAGQIAQAADRIFVTIPGWTPILRKLAPHCMEPEWLPVPSNLPTSADPLEVATIRARLQPDRDAKLIGHFGTYGHLIAEPLRAMLPLLLTANPSARCVLLGLGSQAFLETLTEKAPEIKSRCVASGELSEEAVAAHLAACDLLIQPYPDGISARRTSAMSGLALGVPTLTTQGALTEPIWPAEGAVVLAPAGDFKCMANLGSALLNDSVERVELAKRGQRLYQSRFCVENLIQRLRSDPKTSGD